MKIPYTFKKMKKQTLLVIAQAIRIIEGYEKMGLRLTLRQLYYQFVSRDWIPNTEESYKRIGSIINDARMCGLIDWDSIEDRTRSLRSHSSFKNPKEVLRAAAASYHLDRWANQECRVEVWCEKEALIGVFARVATKWDCPFFACKGYPSQTAKWQAAQRMIEYQNAGQSPVLLYFGDHDPSGIDITRDIRDSMATFGASVFVERLALNKSQVDEYAPPPNPAKMSDSRSKQYVAKYGMSSWELDALDPPVLMSLVEDAVKKYRDLDKWIEVVEQEKKDLAALKAIPFAWPRLYSYLVKNESELLDKMDERILEEAGRRYDLEVACSGYDGEGIVQAQLGGAATFCSECGILLEGDGIDIGMCWDCGEGAS